MTGRFCSMETVLSKEQCSRRRECALHIFMMICLICTSGFLFLFLLTPHCIPLSLVEMKGHCMLASPTCFSPDRFLEVRSVFFKSQISESKYIRHSCFSCSKTSNTCSNLLSWGFSITSLALAKRKACECSAGGV